jgi:hypothetical protein
MKFTKSNIYLLLLIACIIIGALLLLNYTTFNDKSDPVLHELPVTYQTNVSTQYVLEAQKDKEFISHDINVMSGIVCFSSGGAVSGAVIWIEAGQYLACEPFKVDKQTVIGLTTQSMVNGTFTLPTIITNCPYLIKAYVKGYPITFVGPFDMTKSPTQCIILTISDTGGRLMGSFENTKSEPLTNVLVYYRKEISTKDSYEMAKIMRISAPTYIDSDGRYVTDTISPGVYTISFQVPDYKREQRVTTIYPEKNQYIDILFYELPSYTTTVTVLDYESKLPVPFVNFFPTQTPATPIFTTDINGQYTLITKNIHVNYYIYHPGYAPCSGYIATDRETNKIITLSQKSVVEVYVDNVNNDLVTNGTVMLMQKHRYSYRRLFRKPVSNGYVVFTNVPSRPFKINVGLYKEENGFLESGYFTLAPDTSTNIYFSLISPATFIVRFTEPVDVPSIHTDFYPKEKYTLIRSQFEKTSSEFRAQTYITGVWHFSIEGKRIEYFSTNIILSAGTQTILSIDNSSSQYACITGQIRSEKGMISLDGLQTHVILGDKRVIGDVYFNTNGTFHTVPLRPDKKYDLNIRLSYTNIYFSELDPNGPPLDIVIPQLIRLTGKITDQNGTPLSALLHLNSHCWRVSGEFSLYPVMAGAYSMKCEAQGYEPIIRKVLLNESQQDLGEIVFY